MNKIKNPPPILFLIISVLISLGAYKFIPDLLKGKNSVSEAMASRISSGNQILLTSQTTADKQAGVTAFAREDYKEAVQKFQASLQKNCNDPETLIYLNNALNNAKEGDRTSLKIAVSVPSGSNPNIAQEILRGVAQAQHKINATGGINGAGLQVEIVNDNNLAEVAKEVATALTNDPKILAVIGHNDSTASLAAAPIYQEKGLVMITPTSGANNLSGFGSYIFRTVPNTRSMTAPLAEYIVKGVRKTNIAFCYDSQAAGNTSLRDEFIASLSASGGRLIPIICDFSAPTFNPNSAIADAVSQGAQGLMIASHVDRIDRAIDLARANQGKLALYSSSTLYTFQTLKDGQKDVDGLVLPVPWHPDTNPNNPFPKNARQRWGGVVNWRTATSYDATQAVIAGLQQNNTREGLQQALKSPSFSTPGASEDVRFLPTGDRAGKPILVQVKLGGSSGYNFVPLR